MSSSHARPSAPLAAHLSSSVYNLLSSDPSDRHFDLACSAPVANGSASSSYATGYLGSHLAQVFHCYISAALGLCHTGLDVGVGDPR